MVRKILGKLQTGVLLILAAGTPVVTVVSEQYWFEKRMALAGAGVVMLALWAARVWSRGQAGQGPAATDAGWVVFGAALLAAAAVPTGRVANLMSPDLWAALGAILAFFAIKNTLTNSKQIKWGFAAILVGLVAAVVLVAAGHAQPAPWATRASQLQETLGIVKRSPVFGEFREFRSAKLGILQTASGLGILGILGILALVYQIGLKSVKEIFKSSSIWWKVLNILVLVLLAGFLVLPHPALMLWPLAIAAALSCGIAQVGPISPIGPMRKGVWAAVGGLLIVIVLGSFYGLGRVVWGETKFREALAAASRNEGIATYYALLESIKRNPYEVRYHLLASQIDIALANSIAAQSATATDEAGHPPEADSGPAATESAKPRMTAQDQNNILILIQQAVVEGKKAIQLDPKNPALWQNLASIYRGLVGVAGGAEDWALKSYQRAVELNSQDPNPWLQIGEIHFVGGNFDGAAEAFKEAVRIDPHFIRAHYDLAVAYNALNEVDKAIEELRETLALLPADDPSREQVEKDLAFLKGDAESETLRVDEKTLRVETDEATPSTELKEATSSAEVESPPPPVGPEATESAEWQEPELEEGR
jgi:tetratricopeptide (TPR) repeat protein